MTRILVLSRGAVGKRMASPGIRAYQLAGALGRALPDAEITLAVPPGRGEVRAPATNVRLQPWADNHEAVGLARSHDVTIARNFPPQFARLLGDRKLALDAFTPLYIEWMELSKRDIEPRWRRTWMAGNRWYLNLQLTLADFIFCADERQRDMWIGMLMALALVPPDVYERDPSLRRFIDMVPYGVSQAPLDARGPVLRGVVQGIGGEDRIVLWNGAVTEWNDPFTLLDALTELAPRRPELKLVFMGCNHPDMVFGPGAGVLARAIQRARDLGLENRSVFFLEGWVPYDRIDDYLVEADVSVCLGYETIESRFAFRTRFVDAFRARVPLLCTRGDVLADRVADDPLGVVVPERDASAVAAGIERLLDDGDFTNDLSREPRAYRPRTGVGHGCGAARPVLRLGRVVGDAGRSASRPGLRARRRLPRPEETLPQRSPPLTRQTGARRRRRTRSPRPGALTTATLLARRRDGCSDQRTVRGSGPRDLRMRRRASLML